MAEHNQNEQQQHAQDPQKMAGSDQLLTKLSEPLHQPQNYGQASYRMVQKIQEVNQDVFDVGREVHQLRARQEVLLNKAEEAAAAAAGDKNTESEKSTET